MPGRTVFGIEPAVAAVIDAGFNEEIEVLVPSVLSVKITGLRSRPDENAALDTPVAWLLRINFPPGQVLAVEQGLELRSRIVFPKSGE